MSRALKLGWVGMMALSLAACSAHRDLQGHDPVEYYKDHPQKNTVESREHTSMVYFEPGRGKLAQAEVEKLQRDLREVSMPAVDSVQVSLSTRDARNMERRAYLSRTMRRMGFDKGEVTFSSSSDMPDDRVSLFLTYAVVVAPECPDWRRSPVTSYSNTSQGNFNCANEVNLGLMVADPNDLVGGTGKVQMDTGRATRAISNYQSGTSAAPASASSPSASMGAAAEAAPPPPQ